MPRAAFSHSASVGRRFPSHSQYVRAWSQLTHATGWFPLRLCPQPATVQLPPEPLAFTRGKLEEAVQRSRSWEERAGRLKESLARLRQEFSDHDAQAAALKPALEAAREEAARLAAQLDAARGGPESSRERDELSKRLKRLELELQVARERVVEAERRLGQQRSEAESAALAEPESSLGVEPEHHTRLMASRITSTTPPPTAKGRKDGPERMNAERSANGVRTASVAGGRAAGGSPGVGEAGLACAVVAAGGRRCAERLGGGGRP